MTPLDLLPLSIGIGLVISLVFSETFGLAAGGMIVPGYLALSLARPLDVAVTIAAGFLTFALVRGISTLTIVYGRRRTVLMILVGYLVGMAVRWSGIALGATSAELAVIGFIIPGLIALWLDRQGVIETLSALVTAAVAVRLTLVLLVGEELRS